MVIVGDSPLRNSGYGTDFPSMSAFYMASKSEGYLLGGSILQVAQ